MIRIVIAAVFALVLVGCSSAPVAVPSTSPAVAISDAQYLEMVRAQEWSTPNMADATLLKLGSAACGLITEVPADAQLTGWKRAVDAASSMMSQREAGEFLVYASARFCPDARDAYFPKS